MSSMKPNCVVYSPQDKNWCVLVEYTESVRKLKQGDYLLNKKIDVVMDMRKNDED